MNGMRNGTVIKTRNGVDKKSQTAIIKMNVVLFICTVPCRENMPMRKCMGRVFLCRSETGLRLNDL